MATCVPSSTRRWPGTRKYSVAGVALRDKLFLFMSRNATPATEYFRVPGHRLVELGTQVAI